MSPLHRSAALLASVIAVTGMVPATSAAGLATEPASTHEPGPPLLPWSRTQRLTPPTLGPGGSAFGTGLAVDGDRILVGEHLSPRSYVYERTDDGWARSATLTAELDGEPASPGTSVALDGDTAVAGAWWEPAAFVFEATADGWVQTGTLTPEDGDGRFGVDVAVDGGTVLVGAYRGDAAYVFEEGDEGFSQVARLTPEGGGPALFGYAVDLEDGTALVGAPHGSGAAYVFEDGGDGWRQQARLRALDTDRGDGFGVDVALDAGRALVGAFEAESSGTARGAAYLFHGSGGGWSQTAKLAPTTPSHWDFGYGVALEGQQALVGAPDANRNLFSARSVGAAYVFQGAGAVWQETAKLTSGTVDTHDDFAREVALEASPTSSGPATALVGAPYEGAGTAYVFEEAGGAVG